MMRARPRRTQAGYSIAAVVALLAVLAFMMSIVFKMLPHYMDYMSLEKIITRVESEDGLEVRTVGQFYSHVVKGMTVNGIRDLRVKEILKVRLVDGVFQVHLKYEQREPLIQNLDLVARFDKEYLIRKQ